MHHVQRGEQEAKVLAEIPSVLPSPCPDVAPRQQAVGGDSNKLTDIHLDHHTRPYPTNTAWAHLLC